jgi:hypothetical protein
MPYFKTVMFAKAEKLDQVAACVTLEPLESGDPRYVDVAKGRDTKELKKLRLHLSDMDARNNHFAKVAFTGHRGCGKSTELLKLEYDLSTRFTCLHLYVDDNLIRDCDYTDLILWLVDSLAREFANRDMPLDTGLVDDVVGWFAERTLEKVEAVKSELTLEAEAKGEAKAGFYWLSLKLLARLKSALVGSVERRKVIRQTLQTYSSDLIKRVNLLLDNAQSILEKNGKTPDLLIVQDNLDRLPVEIGRRLFFDNGDLLKSLRAHVIYTVPIAMVLAPWNIDRVFPHTFTMQMVKTHSSDDREFLAGMAALESLVTQRVNVDSVFTSHAVLRHLARNSGGSVRDLMRLVDYAQLAARVDEKDQIDEASAKEAVKKLRLDFERLLIPGQVYYPLLAQVHRTKGDGLTADPQAKPDDVKAAREFFSQLFFNGSVMEYNGEKTWYDVHPAVCEIEEFKNACQRLNPPAAA